MSTIGLGYERNGLQLYIYKHIHVYIYICVYQTNHTNQMNQINLMNRKDDIIIFIGSHRDDYRNRLLL